MNVALYNGEVELTFNDKLHRYTVDGKPKQGVTSVLKILGKDNLIQWAANMVCEYVRSLTIHNDGHYIVHESDLEQAKYAHVRRRDQSADSGKIAHAWVEAHIKGEKPVLPDNKDAIKSIKAFLKWEDAVKPTYLFSEQVVYSRKYDYCGTADIAFEIDGVRYLGDLKTGNPDSEYRAKRYTGKKRAYNEHLLQVAAYDVAYQEEHAKPFAKYMVIYITKQNGLHTFEYSNLDELKDAWLSVLKTHRSVTQINFNNEYKEIK